jgi:hypothetical protein
MYSEVTFTILLDGPDFTPKASYLWTILLQPLLLFSTFLFILYDFLLLSNIASCAGEGIHATMHFRILPEIYPPRSRGETHFRRCMFCTTSGFCTSGQKRGNYSRKYIYKDIFSRILHGTGRKKWNPAINHQKFVEHLYFIQKLLLEVQEVHR